MHTEAENSKQFCFSIITWNLISFNRDLERKNLSLAAIQSACLNTLWLPRPSPFAYLMCFDAGLLWRFINSVFRTTEDSHNRSINGPRLIGFLLIFVFVAPAYSGSVDSGIAPYERCALCHGLFGNTPRSKFPKLAGQNPKYLEQQIQNFLLGHRSNDGGQMATVVTEIAITDIPEIVSWFSTQAAPDPFDTYNAEGERMFVDAGCIDCHKEQTGPDVLVPLLASQHPEYLTKQMVEIRDGIRSGDNSGVMRAQLQTLSQDKIESIANYSASLERQR